jgi:hypothetical protein
MTGYLPFALTNRRKTPRPPQRLAGGFSLCYSPLDQRMIRALANRTNGDVMTASAEEDVLVTVSETLGSAAGKVVAGAKRTASSLGEEKKQLVRVATKVRSKASRAIKKTQKKAKKAASSAKRAVASAKKSVKRVARKLKRR